MPIVQIQIVTWNSKNHLPRLFAGLRCQTINYDLLVIDNASTDGTVEWLKQNFSVVPAQAGIHSSDSDLDSGSGAGMTVKLIQNNTNRGFSGGHNQGFAVCSAPFVLVLNPDAELGRDYLDKSLKVMQSDERIGAVAGKLYRRLPERPPLSPPLDKGGRWEGIIDSCGLAMKPWGQVVNIGEGQSDYGQFDAQRCVFGASGACALYRLEALKAVADKYGIFDQRFGAYKEDVDLAWRLRNAGWKTIFVPDAIAYHPRAVRRDNRREHNAVIRQSSLRNHLLMLKKNLSRRDWRRIPLILGYELIKFIYVLLFERDNATIYFQKTPNFKHQ